MTANEDVVIERKDNGYIFTFRGVSTFKPKKSQPVLVAPLINLSTANTFLFRFFGPSETVNFSFVIFDDGVDVAKGSYTSTVVTIKEQVQYLKNVIFTENFDESWYLYEFADIVYPVSDKIEGVLTDLDLDLTSKAKVYIPGTIAFQRGRIGEI